MSAVGHIWFFDVILQTWTPIMIIDTTRMPYLDRDGALGSSQLLSPRLQLVHPRLQLVHPRLQFINPPKFQSGNLTRLIPNSICSQLSLSALNTI